MAPLRTTAFINLKGGVGKTTTAINAAAILAASGKKVLLVDADSQCNTTEFVKGESVNGSTFSDLLRQKVPEMSQKVLLKTYIKPSKLSGVDLLAADDSLMDLDLSAVKAGGAQVHTLRLLLDAVKDLYDAAIIDCPPAFNAACAAALVASDDVIIPIKLDAFSLQGMGNLTRQITNMRNINPRLKLAGVLPTMYYDSEDNKLALAMLEGSGLHVFHRIRQSKPAEKMTWKQEPIIQCSPRSAAAVDYRKFVAEYWGGNDHV